MHETRPRLTLIRGKGESDGGTWSIPDLQSGCHTFIVKSLYVEDVVRNIGER